MYLKKETFIDSCIIKFTLIAFIVFSMYCASNILASDFPWIKGDRVYGVKEGNGPIDIESGYVVAYLGDTCRVKWDSCPYESMVPVQQMYRSFCEAQRADDVRDKDGSSFKNGGKSAGKIGLLYMLMGRRGAK
ncbi:MAG: hypothetical protein RBR49_12760 [Desulfovibrio desulfuricans]|nr:hypothetical protein [Desulfovibrio desulfuricans]